MTPNQREHLQERLKRVEARLRLAPADKGALKDRDEILTRLQRHEQSTVLSTRTPNRRKPK